MLQRIPQGRLRAGDTAGDRNSVTTFGSAIAMDGLHQGYKFDTAPEIANRDAVVEELASVLRSERFQRSPRHRKFLSLISTGNRCAVASRGNLAAQGPLLWRLKDWIDRRWMLQYQMPAERARASTA